MALLNIKKIINGLAVGIIYTLLVAYLKSPWFWGGVGGCITLAIALSVI